MPAFSRPASGLVYLLILVSASAADKPKHPANRLARETSPYLLMHAHNPVDWYPWGPEAFEKAKKDNKLVFLSIGYSSCYWCHVMERQSFDSAEIAKLMNEHFVCIKVDREERPDVDSIYMTALHVQGRQGGWPLSLFLTPEGKPILGGTYFPPDDREIEGKKIHGFKSILRLINDDWKNRQDALKKHADQVAEAVRRETAGLGVRLVAVDLNRDLVKEVVAAVQEEYDSVHGGFSSKARQFRGPKFPTPPLPELLLADHALTKDEAALKMITHTLDRMAMGGIYDHLGGGFHRYSVDREWKVPHFEKMLYDNGQLVSLYSRAFTLTKKPTYRRVVEETLVFIQREMTSPEGAFYSALDAETEAEEGRFYVWTAAELDAALPKADVDLFKTIYAADAGPNFEEKYHILLLPQTLAEQAARLKMTEDQLVARLAASKERLLAVRSKRPRPFLDTKILTSWNGLMIAGYADAATALKNPAYAEAAERAADFLLANLRSKDGRLLRTYSRLPDQKTGQAKLAAYLEDYSFLVHGLLRLHVATGKPKWLAESVRLTDEMLAHYQDAQSGGFFFTAHDHEKLFARAKDQYDGATPSGNSVAALNLVELAKKTGEPRFHKAADDTFKSFSAIMKTNPNGATAMARALSLHLAPSLPKGGPGGVGAPNAPPPEDDLFKSNKPATAKKTEPVKLTATVTPKHPPADGQQTVTIIMEIEKGWHAYANPAGLENLIPTTVTIAAKAKPEEVKIDYPKGREMKDPAVGDPVRVYEGKTTIKATLRRPVVNGKPDDSPLEISVRYQVCDDSKCLPPKTVKVPIGERGESTPR